MTAYSKTKGVTILGWIFIGLGILDLLSVSMFILGVPFIVIGIGILKRKKWSRNAGIIYEWFQVVLSIGLIGVSCGLGFVLVGNAEELTKSETAQGLFVWTMMGFVLVVLNFGFSLGLIYWLNRPLVKEEIIC